MTIGTLKRISIIAALVSIAVSVFMWAQLSGIEYGFFYGVFQEPPTYGFAAHGPNYYQSLNIWYLTISICLGFVLITQFFKPTVAGSFLRILILAFGAISTWNMIEFKKFVLGIREDSFVWFDPYPWLGSSIFSDWFCISAFFLLLVVQIWIGRLIYDENTLNKDRLFLISK